MKMLKSASIRYTVYGTLLIVLSEVVYHSCRSLKNWYNRVQSKPKELWAVILTNQLSQLCSAKHQANSRKLDAISLNSREALDKIKIIERAPVCANPYCMDSNIGLIEDLLNATKYSIDLAMFMISSITLAEALVQAHKRGVIIRIITNEAGAFWTSSRCLYLLKYGIAIRFNYPMPKKLMHHKFCILDSPSTVKRFFREKKVLLKIKLEEINKVGSILMTGSANWTVQGFATNAENILLTNQQQLIEQYSDEFQRMWELFAPSPSKNADRKSDCIQLIFLTMFAFELKQLRLVVYRTIYPRKLRLPDAKRVCIDTN
uniref:Mitochondrial cardiolipin hydrolase n=1 Tax=Glossina austeni TaxID=7395 RepID=A0A1A9ULK5_GLOAU